MTVESVKEFGLSRKDAARAKNMYALGLVSWLYGRDVEGTVSYLEAKFAKVPGDPRRQRGRAQGRLVLRRDDRDVRGLLHGEVRPRRRPVATATSPATRPCPTAWSRRGG